MAWEERRLVNSSRRREWAFLRSIVITPYGVLLQLSPPAEDFRLLALFERQGAPGIVITHE
jgi:hypothetical protein